MAKYHNKVVLFLGNIEVLKRNDGMYEIYDYEIDFGEVGTKDEINNKLRYEYLLPYQI